MSKYVVFSQISVQNFHT